LVAKDAHLSSVELTQVPFLEFTATRTQRSSIASIPSFNPSPRSQRAPPLV
jgi:hypothetical protein